MKYIFLCMCYKRVCIVGATHVTAQHPQKTAHKNPFALGVTDALLHEGLHISERGFDP